jgi:hypothetical protein
MHKLLMIIHKNLAKIENSLKVQKSGFNKKNKRKQQNKPKNNLYLRLEILIKKIETEELSKIILKK